MGHGEKMAGGAHKTKRFYRYYERLVDFHRIVRVGRGVRWSPERAAMRGRSRIALNLSMTQREKPRASGAA